MDDIQQVKRHVYLMRKDYTLYDISQFFIFKSHMKEKYMEFKNLFVGLDVLFLDEKNDNVQDANGRKLEELLKLKIGKFALPITIIRRLFNTPV